MIARLHKGWRRPEGDRWWGVGVLTSCRVGWLESSRFKHLPTPHSRPKKEEGSHRVLNRVDSTHGEVSNKDSRNLITASIGGLHPLANDCIYLCLPTEPKAFGNKKIEFFPLSNFKHLISPQIIKQTLKDWIMITSISHVCEWDPYLIRMIIRDDVIRFRSGRERDSTMR